MAYLLDTNAWLRLFHRPEELSQASRLQIQNETTLWLSPMSIVEVAQKVAKGRLELPAPVEEWVEQSMPPGIIELAPITSRVALAAYRWPAEFHGDPADRIIAATAIVMNLVLVTSDEKLLSCRNLPTLSTR